MRKATASKKSKAEKRTATRAKFESEELPADTAPDVMSSFPSNLTTFIDVPEVQRLRARFYYNFFVYDESVNENPDMRTSKTLERMMQRSAGKVNVTELRKRVPRFIKIDFKPLQLTSDTENKNPFRPRDPDDLKLPELSIAEFYDSIMSETSIGNAAFTGIPLQDTGADGKLGTLMAAAAAVTTKQSTFKWDEASATDQAKILNEKTSDLVSGQSLVKILNNTQPDTTRYFDSATSSENIRDALDPVKEVMIPVQLNNKFIEIIARSAANDMTSVYSDEFQEIRSAALILQESTISNSDISNLDEEEYDVLIEPIRQRLVDASEFQEDPVVTGYVIDKSEILPGGGMKKFEPIILEDANTSSHIDLNVRYGAVYVYQIRAIAQIEVQSLSEEVDEVISSTILVSSKPGGRSVARCIERKPPPIPADFDVRWDYNRDKLCIMWNFSPNPQRDIKKFQVFRRKTVREPFQMIMMYDFDDSVEPLPYIETPNLNRVTHSDQPVLYHYDDNFTKESTYIYTICALDARNLTSNYALQLRVSFNRLTNRVEKEVVSPGNAPKSYPNIFLNHDLFVDTIRDSSHSRMKLFFDPEYLKVVNARNRDMNLLAPTQKGGSYQLQFLNVDHQKSQVIEIYIDDLQTVERKDAALRKVTSQNQTRRRHRVKGRKRGR